MYRVKHHFDEINLRFGFIGFLIRMKIAEAKHFEEMVNWANKIGKEG